MISLGTIRLPRQWSVYQARNKIRGLAGALGFDEINTTRLATAVSEAARMLRTGQGDPRISVFLAMDASPPQLVLDFHCHGQMRLECLTGFFDCMHDTDSPGGGHTVRGVRWLPRPVIVASVSFIEEQRHLIQKPSL